MAINPPTMKILSLLAVIAMSCAFVALVPLSFEAILSVGFAAGLIGIAIADYTKPRRAIAEKYSVYAPRSEQLRLAA